MKLLNILRRFRKDESGASMVEYGVALMVVTLIGIAAVTNIGTSLKGVVDKADAAITAGAAKVQ